MMKALLLAISIISMNLQPIYANEDLDSSFVELNIQDTFETLSLDSDDIEIESQEFLSNYSSVETLKIKEVRTLLSTLDQNSTCLDEYLKRRRQLITKLTLTPITAAGSLAVSLYAGGAVGVGLSTFAATAGDPWAALGYFIVGAGAGVIGAAGYVVYDTSKSSIEMYDNNIIIKALAEQYLYLNGAQSERLYQKYVKQSKSKPLSRTEYFQKLMMLDKSQSLCNASVAKQPKFKIGSKLKYKLASTKEINKSM